MRRRRKPREPETMSEETKAMLAENRKAKRAADEEERLAKMAAQPVSTWRRKTLSRYTARVLELHGRDRLEFMEAHPVGELFR